MSDSTHNVFVSHTHADKPLVSAFKEVVNELFAPYVSLYSSSDFETGPAHGENWLDWIYGQVKSTDFALVFITPASLAKPWILWESGAVDGAAIALGTTNKRRVRPLLFRVSNEQVPDPFRGSQVVQGEDFDNLLAMFLEWMNLLPPTVSAKAGRKLDATLQELLNRVKHTLDNAPLVAVDAAVQDWAARLDELRAQNRMSEVKNLRRWIDIAFGRDPKDPKPLDVRLHRRMGELYLQTKSYDDAATQFELARLASPRDILILRQLGQAYLGLADEGSDTADAKVSEVIAKIETLDGSAFELNVECAALKGRWLRTKDPKAAREVYIKAFARNRDSYYLGDNLGQLDLELGELKSAQDTYEKVLAIINASGEKNLWVQATAVNAAIVSRADPSVVQDQLKGILEFKPTPEQLKSIEGGLQRIRKALAMPESAYNEWLAALRQ